MSGLDPRARLLLSQMRETLREFDKKLADILKEDRFVELDEFTISKQEPSDRLLPEHRPRRQPIICRKCGFKGGNARGCGKPSGHPTLQPQLAIVK